MQSIDQCCRENGILYSVCFLQDGNDSYIVSSNCDWDENPEKIKIFDFNGNIIKEINDSNAKAELAGNRLLLSGTERNAADEALFEQKWGKDVHDLCYSERFGKKKANYHY